jgi:hypothetical protein
MARRSRIYEKDIFLNVPFDVGYERNLVALIASLTALGKIPRCILELPELGSGRLKRLLKHLERCRISIHDLSRVGVPVRFNMPFELGLACAMAEYRKPHYYFVMEKELYRLDRILSDLKGRDPLIHNNSPKQIITGVLSMLRSKTRNPDPNEVYKNFRKLLAVAKKVKSDYGESTIFSRAIFIDLVDAGIELAELSGHIKR